MRICLAELNHCFKQRNNSFFGKWIKMVNFKFGNELWKINWATWHGHGAKKNSESPTGIKAMPGGGGRTPDGRSIHWATRTHREQDHAFNWVDMLQASCTLLGSALSKSSWVWQMNKMVFFLITLLSIRKQSHIFESKKSIQFYKGFYHRQFHRSNFLGNVMWVQTNVKLAWFPDSS